ncbi:hypothetical protein HA402_004086 [Bradysia odoriphaga]|nr:hypothetical protein HA402_004086 [Bradysia odoriphaga]
MGKKSKASNLGRSLIRDRFNHGGRRTVDNNSMLHTTEVQDGYDWGRLNLQSVTEESSFQEFLRTAELAGTEFQAEKLNIAFVNPKSTVGILSASERAEAERKHIDKKNLLKIPRRPKWTAEMSAQDLQTKENLSFLEWRRGLAMLQEDDGLLLTPYEKNLEFWRQLWRVVERSDVVVQIVDARNPLLFHSEDLERYVKEVSEHKMNMVLVNKADFLTEQQRHIWAEYFQSRNIQVAFFSAILAQEEIKKEQHQEREAEELNRMKDLNVSEVTELAKNLLDSLVKTEQQLNTIIDKIEAQSSPPSESSSTKILTRSELIELFRNIHNQPKVTEGLTTIGLVGYPNVGKSSTINSLMIEKKVSVSATPGKTKHFQTLFLDKDLLLCDCPGLVMPSFVLTKADMILNGILPIDQMRDFVPPVNVLCTQIPRHILEDRYGIMIAKPPEGEDPKRPPYAEELLLSYGYNRGFMTANGQPDQSRSARYVLKEYVCGKLLFCHAPPGIDQSEFHTFPDRVRSEIVEQNLPKQQQRALRISRHETTNDIDSTFFNQSTNTAYIKGSSNFPHIRHGSTTSASGTSSVNGSMQGLNAVVQMEKPWRHQKKEKREKLRRKFAHLDEH